MSRRYNKDVLQGSIIDNIDNICKASCWRLKDFVLRVLNDCTCLSGHFNVEESESFKGTPMVPETKPLI